MAAADEEIARKRRGKNIAVALGLLALVLMFYLITVVKISGNIAGQPPAAERTPTEGKAPS